MYDLIEKLLPSSEQFSKINSESLCSTLLSNKEVLLWKIINLGSKEIGTNIDSGNLLRSSRDLEIGVEFGSKLGSKSKIDVRTLFPLAEYDRKILVIPFHVVLVQDSIFTLEY